MNDSKTAEDPLRIEVRGETLALSVDEARAVLQSLHRQLGDRAAAERDEARAAGQVWIAVYWRYGGKSEEECFSLREAANYLEYGEEEGTLSSESIRCPDGTVYTREDRDLDWRQLPALQAEKAGSPS